MKAYHVIVIIAEISVVGALFGYIGYIIWDKVHNKLDGRPHVILIVAEDLGWSDVSFHGENEIHTPNIDALAYNGVILNRHYVATTAKASRISLMTGRYALRKGTQSGVSTTSADVPRAVPRNVTLMPKFLRDLGYETKLLGPWDLGGEFQYVEDQEPTHWGFDYWRGYYSSWISHFNESRNATTKNVSEVIGSDLHRNDSSVALNSSGYFSDAITNEAVKIIKCNANKKPLFLEISNLAPDANFSWANFTDNFAYIADKNRRRRAEAIKALDDSVGRVVGALSDTGMLKNSVVVLISSNGAASNYPLRGAKNTPFEGGVRGAACVFSPLIRKPMKLSRKYVHATDWLPTLYSAAGGNVSRLGDIDGVDQWASLVYDRASRRQRVLLDVDELPTTGYEAAIVGRHKFVKFANKSVDGYYGDEGNSTSYPVYDVAEALNSTAGRAIGKLDNFFSATEDEAWESRELAAVHCRRPTNYPECKSGCLFDIVGDPCETRDLSKLMPNETLALKSFIDDYRRLLVHRDLCSYSNGTWRRDGTNSSTVVPNNLCYNNTMKNNASMPCCGMSMKNHTSMNNNTVLAGGMKNNTSIHNNTAITSNLKNNTSTKNPTIIMNSVKNNTSTKNATTVINDTKNHTSINNNTVLAGGVNDNTSIRNDTAITSNAKNNTKETRSPWDKIWKFMSKPMKN